MEGCFFFPFEHKNHKSWFNDSKITTVQLVRVTELTKKEGMVFWKKHTSSKRRVHIWNFQLLCAVLTIFH